LIPRPTLAAPITLSVLPSLQAVSVGDTFSVGVAIGNVADLFDYQFDLTFDPTILRADSVSDGGFLTSAGGTSVFTFLGFPTPDVLALDNTTGLVTALDSLLGPAPPTGGASGNGFLANIVFTALVVGGSDVGLANIILEDSLGNALGAQLSGARVDVTDAGS